MKILHLEMSQFFSRVIRKVSEANGHEYRSERSIKAGLAALDEWKYDLLVTSRILEDGRAETLLETLAETPHKDTPVIVITGDGSLDVQERFFNLGVMDFLLKSDIVPDKLAMYFRIIEMGGEILEELKDLRVAVLDDSIMGLNVVRSIFNYYGVTHAEYFASPRDMLDSDPFDLYIIDMVMPGMTGEEVLMHIREQDGHSGVIVVSGVSNRLAMSHALCIGADDYITKPFDARNFIARVKGVVRHLLLLRELEDKSRQMEEQARQDSLTGLWNHGAIHEYLEHEVQRLDDDGLSVALFDMDNFKGVNDLHGHQAGDDVLIAVSDILNAGTGDRDRAGRYGGEEFLLVMPGRDRDSARRIAENVLERIRKADMGIRGLKLTASCGIAGTDECGEALKLVELADERLYEGKDAGKDRIVG